MDNRKIGVFDSGLGGLTVVHELSSLMPAESVVYFGDTARLPYGSKSKERITEFSLQIMRFLETQNVKAVIVACGTASTNAMDELQGRYDVPLLGVAEPGARAAARATKSGRIGVIGTVATIGSGAFERLLFQQDNHFIIQSRACPLFVPLVEEGWFESAVTEQVARIYLEPLCHTGVDTLVLGCTHYPLLEDTIGSIMGKEVSLINVSRAAVLEMKAYLEKEGLTADPLQSPSLQIYASDTTEAFRAFARRVLGRTDVEVQKKNLEA